MTTSVQRRRGTTVQHSTFTGLEGEITVDTTKDTAVVHNGSTAGGFPLAREDLSNAAVTSLSAITGSNTADDDLFIIYDTSTSTLKKITRAELNNAIEQDALSNVSITGGSINGTTVGASTASTGAFTTLSASGAFSANGGATLGDASGDALTINSSAVSIPNGLTFSGGTTTFSNNQVISVTDNTNAALRITQLGTGNALLVEDSSNPDSTPFVVNADGRTIVGHTTAIANPDPLGTSRTPSLEVITNDSDAGGALGLFAYRSNNTGTPYINFSKSAGTIASPSALTSSYNTLGSLLFQGYDGTNFINAAFIQGSLDGTPGTNDMPGRLVFSTTADGASSPTERMRIDNAGRIGIAGTAQADTRFHLLGALPSSSNNSKAQFLQYTIPSTTTGQSVGVLSFPSTQAASFTLGQSMHFYANQGTIGAGSSITNQFGFYAESTLTGATNNYGFYSNIAFGTGRYNFYAQGNADNYFAGNVGIGGAPSVNLDVTGSGTRTIRAFSTDTSGTAIGRVSASFGSGASSSLEMRAGNGYGYLVSTGASDPLIFGTNTTERIRIDSSGNLLVGYSSSVSSLGYAQGSQFYRTSGTIGQFRFSTDNGAPELVSSKARGSAGSPTIVSSGDGLWLGRFAGYDGTNYVEAARVSAEVDGTPGTNDMPGRLIFFTTADGASSPTERMRIDSSGNVGIGTSSLTDAVVKLGKNITGGSGYSNGLINVGTIQSDVTTRADIYSSFPATQATSFTLSSLNHYFASGLTIGAGSTVTTQSGFHASSSLTGATNNYGFYGNIASGTGRYNFYAAGTANNYFAGSVGIGTNSLTGYNFYVNKNLTGATGSSSVANSFQIQSDVTAQAVGYATYTTTAASAFTLTTLKHFNANQGSLGAGSAISNQIGFHVESSLTGATNNYGFYSNIASGTGRYNFYAVGTAANYFAGDMQFNKTITAAGTTGAQTINKNAGTVNFAASATSLVVTNSLVTTSSIIIATVGTNDTTMKSVTVVAGSGSFTIYSNAAATSETRVNFIVIN